MGGNQARIWHYCSLFCNVNLGPDKTPSHESFLNIVDYCVRRRSSPKSHSESKIGRTVFCLLKLARVSGTSSQTVNIELWLCSLLFASILVHVVFAPDAKFGWKLVKVLCLVCKDGWLAVACHPRRRDEDNVTATKLVSETWRSYRQTNL